VDDEPLARKVLEKYISRVPSLNLIHQCKNAVEAAAYLHEHKADVMFLDIKMPEMTGLELLKTLIHPPQVIFTTAYAEYALEGWEYAAADYLLKPFSFERFLKAVNRVQPQKAAVADINAEKQKDEKGFIFLREDKIDYKIFYSDMDFIEGYGNFVKVHTKDKVLVVSEKISSLEEMLPPEHFIRTHKSYIVSLEKIDKIEGNMISVCGKEIPIGGYYRKKLFEIVYQNKQRR
jgi:DNA-binding LytR/AlgR family response regulator